MAEEFDYLTVDNGNLNFYRLITEDSVEAALGKLIVKELKNCVDRKSHIVKILKSDIPNSDNNFYKYFSLLLLFCNKIEKLSLYSNDLNIVIDCGITGVQMQILSNIFINTVKIRELVLSSKQGK